MINLSFSLSSKHFIVCEKLTCGRTRCLCCISLMYLCIHQVFFIFLGNFGVLSAIWLCILYGYINFFFYPWQQLTQGIFIYFAFILICVCVFMCVLSTHIYMWAKKQLYCILTNSILQCSCIAHFIYSSMPLVYFCDYSGQCW